VVAIPSFEKIEIDGNIRTAIKFDLERRPRSSKNGEQR
jgi:stage V sporulation protein SpoVS